MHPELLETAALLRLQSLHQESAQQRALLRPRLRNRLALALHALALRLEPSLKQPSSRLA